MQANDAELLERLASDYVYSGRPTVINSKDVTPINEGLKLAWQHGFAMNNSTIKHVLFRIATDVSKDYRDGVGSDETVRTYRSHHLEIPYK